MSRNKKLAIVFSVMTCAIILLVIMLIREFGTGNETKPVIDEPSKVTITLKAVGDNLIHSPIYNSCKTEDGFNFDGLYTHITPHIKDADIAAINQETIFVDSVSALSGYPAFGTPPEVGESVAKAGFNLVTHATNHTYDKGADAVFHTIDFWKKHKGVTVIGINENQDKQDSITIWEKGDLKIALLNFTYGLNGYRPPADKSYLINIFGRGEKEEELLSKAEEEADITVVFLHFGTEYTHKPTSSQIKDVEFLTEGGADIIIGTHPHVIQPACEHISENGNRSVVFYSLGNFVSNQKENPKILGGMANVTISKEGDNVSIDSYEMLPTVTHRENGMYSVYMLSDYTDELAKKNTRGSLLSVEKLQTMFDDVMNIEVK
ncbi:MAG: CapA family protein [Clostridia bacterium]|nr:CapA family protein [Clostridia bacterium]